jgi:hypothetical protein
MIHSKQPPTHWEAALAFLLVGCILAVAFSSYQRLRPTTETVCFQFQTVEQMERARR